MAGVVAGAARGGRPLQLTLALLKPDAVAHPLVLEVRAGPYRPGLLARPGPGRPGGARRPPSRVASARRPCTTSSCATASSSCAPGSCAAGRSRAAASTGSTRVGGGAAPERPLRAAGLCDPASLSPQGGSSTGGWWSSWPGTCRARSRAAPGAGRRLLHHAGAPLSSARRPRGSVAAWRRVSGAGASGVPGWKALGLGMEKCRAVSPGRDGLPEGWIWSFLQILCS